MARKLVVSVVSTVVGARLEALDRFFGFRTTLLLAAVAAVLLAAADSDTETKPLSEGNKVWCVATKGFVWFCGEDDEEQGIKPERSVWFGSDLAGNLDHIASRLGSGGGVALCIGSK